MARQHRARGFHATQRRLTDWFDIPWTVTDLTSTSSAALIGTLNAAALAMRPFTIVRTRGTLAVYSNQVIASETARASLALAVVSDEASAVGITAVPTPELNKNSDLFFVYETGFQDFIFNVNGAQTSAFFQKWDSKAMRKVNADQDVAVVIENSALSANGALVEVQGRMLVKLH